MPSRKLQRKPLPIRFEGTCACCGSPSITLSAPQGMCFTCRESLQLTLF
jgi:hypothetical protein